MTIQKKQNKGEYIKPNKGGRNYNKLSYDSFNISKE